MSKFEIENNLRLNVISKHDPTLRVSIIVGTSLTISHLKRKIQTEVSELHTQQIVVRVIQDKNGFVISNNSKVKEHFESGDTIYFSEHDEKQKSGYNMNLPSNIGQILSTIRFMTGSALEKLDKIDLTPTNSLQIITELMHLSFWHSNPSVVQKLFKIYNKILGDKTIEKFITEGSQMQINMMLRNFNFWLVQLPTSYVDNKQITWELLQLLQKFSCNKNFSQMIKHNKIVKTILEISKNEIVSNQIKKIAGRIIKNMNGAGRNYQNKGFSKTKSDYIPSILGSSQVGGHDTEQILALLSSSAQNDKCQALQMIHQNNLQPVMEATVRYSYFQKLMNIFTIRKFKSRKHITIFNQITNNILNNTSKEKYIEIMQKDIINLIHKFLLQAPTQLHSNAIQFAGNTCKFSSSVGLLNIQKIMQVIDSPYQQFQKHIINSISIASQNLKSMSAIRFIPGIRDFIKVSLKTNNPQISYQLLKILSNLTLDQQCRYQIINLKGVQVFVKFLQTSSSPETCRICGKSLLNIAISSRQNKAKVLNQMNGILQIFYQGKYDSVTCGYIQTILKSKNI